MAGYVPNTASRTSKSTLDKNGGAQTALAASDARRGFAVFNNSDVAVYLNFDTVAASTTVFSVKIIAGEFYESPPQPIYQGAVKAYATGGTTGTIQVTEYY